MKQAQSNLDAGQFAAARTSAQAARDLGVDRAKADELTRSIDFAEALQAGRDALQRKQWSDVHQAVTRVFELNPANGEAKRFADEARKEEQIDGLERDALKAFFTGEYEKSVGLLERLILDAPDSGRGYFYLACNNAALGLLAGASGAAKIRQAQSQYARIRARQQDFEVDRRYISSKILQLLDGAPPSSQMRSPP
jgi:hypothetical protein